MKLQFHTNIKEIKSIKNVCKLGGTIHDKNFWFREHYLLGMGTFHESYFGLVVIFFLYVTRMLVYNVRKKITIQE